MQQFIHRYEAEEDKQDCLHAVDLTRKAMRQEGKKSSKLSKTELSESLKKISELRDNDK